MSAEQAPRRQNIGRRIGARGHRRHSGLGGGPPVMAIAATLLINLRVNKGYLLCAITAWRRETKFNMKGGDQAEATRSR
jgi:hypothetical protein